jgi:AcrR family transcriptional regulator
MENVVPASGGDAATLATRAASRALVDRYKAYADDVQRLIDAGFAVMRRTDGIDPRVSDIVHEAGLSNQAFYRHFRGKDELLLAILDDGQRRLVDYLERRMAAGPNPGREQVRRWVEGVMEQARNPEAADNTRPFAINGTRLADRFPEEAARSRELLLRPLRDAVAAAGGNPERDADAIYHLTMGHMHDALVRRVAPSRRDVEHIVQFALDGLGGRRGA